MYSYFIYKLRLEKWEQFLKNIYGGIKKLSLVIDYFKIIERKKHFFEKIMDILLKLIRKNIIMQSVAKGFIWEII